MDHSLRFTMRSAAYVQRDWPKQVDTKNVTKLVRAWTYHMDAGAHRDAGVPAGEVAAAAPGTSEAGDAVAGRGRGGRGGRGDPGAGGEKNGRFKDLE